MPDTPTNKSKITKPDDRGLADAAKALGRGDLVCMPTETVYGLAADATNDQAVASIYAAKGRPDFNPLIVHVANIDAVGDIAILDDAARHLASMFWPGPFLTPGSYRTADLGQCVRLRIFERASPERQQYLRFSSARQRILLGRTGRTRWCQGEDRWLGRMRYDRKR